MLEKREITRDVLEPLLKLKVREDQDNLVAPNVMTIAEAAYEPASVVYGLWDGDIAVGLFAMIDVEKHPDDLEPDEVPEAAYLWRLLIDEKHQGKGYGRAAIELVKQVSKDWGYKKLQSSVVNAPNSNIGFYEAMGFTQTGGVVGGELVIVMDV